MTDEQVEAVAKALHAHEESWNDYEWEYVPPNTQALFRSQARAAISAMEGMGWRAPTTVALITPIDAELERQYDEIQAANIYPRADGVSSAGGEVMDDEMRNRMVDAGRFPIDHSAATVTARDLRSKLDSAALKALRSGMDWAEGPVWSNASDPFLSPDIRSIEMMVKAGPIPPGTDAPAGFRVIRVEDWIAAGRPGEKSAA